MHTRTSNLILPDVHEILDIITNKESKRFAVRPQWLAENVDLVSGFRELCSKAGLEDIFSLPCEDISTENDLARMIQLQDPLKRQLVEYISTHKVDASLMGEVFDQLAVTDDLREADAIYVFGAPSNARIDKAVEIYNKGFSKKIIISGKNGNWQQGVAMPEAVRMCRRAIELGVPAEAVQTETESITLADNVKRTLDMFDKEKRFPESLIIVSSPFTMLRSYTEWMKFPSQPINIIRASAEIQDQNKSRELWHTNDDGRNVVLNEYTKIFGESCVDYYLKNKYANS